MIWFPIALAVLALAGWATGERRDSRRLRVVSGLATVLMAVWAAFLAGRMVESVTWKMDTQFERAYVGMSMERMNDLLTTGHTQEVRTAIQAFNTEFKSYSDQSQFLNASSRLWEQLK